MPKTKRPKTQGPAEQKLPVSQKLVVLNMIWAGHIKQEATADALGLVLDIPADQIREAQQELVSRGAITYLPIQ